MMRRYPSVACVIAFVSAILASSAVTGQRRPVSKAITVSPSDDLKSKVASAPEGAVFVFKPGIYRLASIAPKNLQTFIGEPGAVLSGGRPISFRKEYGYWVAYGQTQQGQVHGPCDSKHPRCKYPEDLFLDDKPLLHVASQSDVGPGRWYFDYDADKVYMGDDPAGHKVEIGAARNAFASGAIGVTIRGFVIEKYAIPAQMGAIGDQYPPADWTVEDCELRLNHGVGIMAGHRWKVRYNKTHDNGQMGMRGAGDGILIEGNEIASNGFAGFRQDWEAGGFKFQSTNGLVIRGNFSHHNRGLGMWTDIDNINTTYEANRVYANTAGGLSHEISYAAVIRNNVLAENGGPDCGWLWSGQIQIQNSQNVEIYGNTILTSASSCGNGITLIYQNRGSGKYGPYKTVNNHVHDNSITQGGSAGRSGAVADYDASTLWNGNNRFENNVYHVADPKQQRWAWAGQWLNWDGFRSRGHEGNGFTVTTSQ